MKAVLCTVLLAMLVSPVATTGAQRGNAAADPGQAGWEALEEKRYADALDAFAAAAAARPRDPAPFAGAGVASFMLGRTSDAESWLQRALALAPNYVDAALLLGELQYRDGRAREAVDTYETALQHAPGHKALTEKLAQWRKDADVQSRSYRSRGAHFTVMFQGTTDELMARRAVEILESAYWRIGAALTTYPTRTITVVLYTQQQFRDITRSPEWAVGAYDGTIRVPVRGALEKPADFERVLAHEFVHALVATLAGVNAPAWLNEGLASMMEPGATPEEDEAVLARAGSSPALSRLEAGFSGLSGARAAAAYAQSTLAVRKMVQLRGAPAVVTLLRDLGRGVAFDRAFFQRIGMRYEDFQTLAAAR